MFVIPGFSTELLLLPPRVFSRSLLIVSVLIGLAACAQPTSEKQGLQSDNAFTFRPEPPPTYETDGLRLATLNAEFLFDGQGHEGAATFPHKGDTARARAHLRRIGTVIRSLEADVVMLQEIENRRVLQLLREGPLDGMGYEVHFVEGRDTFTGQDVGLLSRVPVDTVGRTNRRARVGTSRSTYGVSKNLFARLQLDGQPTTLIGVHFLARPTDPEREDRREAQAEVIAQLVAREHEAGRAVAVLGDFNDYDDETLDFGGHRPLTDVLQRIKRAGPGPADDLRNMMAEVPQRERYTAHWDRDEDQTVDADELSALDHVLLSKALYRRLREVTYVQAHDPLSYTDHFPIVVTLSPPAPRVKQP